MSAVHQGRIRSNWNTALLADVIAPSYARLLLDSTRVLATPWDVLRLWPTLVPQAPWDRVVLRYGRDLSKGLQSLRRLHSAPKGSPTWGLQLEQAKSSPDSAW